MGALHRLGAARFRRAGRIALLARERGRGERWARERCGDDAELAAAVLELLAAAPRERTADPSAGNEGGAAALVRSVAQLAEMADEDAQVGTLLDRRYRLDRLAGTGGMARVYRAHDLRFKRDVAVKILDRGPALLGDLSTEEWERQRSLEAQALAALSHPNVVDVHDAAWSDEACYFVLDWVEGVDLWRWLKHVGKDPAPLPHGSDVGAFVGSTLGAGTPGPGWQRSYWGLVATVLAKVARALAAAHRAGVTHRDVKPANVLLRTDGDPVLTDFGVAAIQGEASLTPASGAVGSPWYMAPEQFREGAERRDPAVDVYGLGATLYHLITFRPPFDGTATEIRGRVETELPTRPRTVVPSVPPELEAICWKALEKRPRDRYAAADTLAEHLEAFVDRRPVPVHMPSRLLRVVRWCQRHPARAVALLLAFLLVAASGLVRDSLAERSAVEAADRRHSELIETLAQLPPVLTLDYHPERAASRGRAMSEAVAVRTRRVAELSGDPLFGFYAAVCDSMLGLAAEARARLDRLAAAGHASALLQQLRGVLGSDEPAERRRWPAPGELEPPTAAFDHALRGYVGILFDDPDFALNELMAAVALAPDVWGYRDLRALAAMDAGQPILAAIDAGRIEEAFRPTARTSHVLGWCARERGRFAEAAALWELSLDLCPDQHAPLNNLGLIRLTLAGREEDAEEAARLRASAMTALEQAVALRPETWTARSQLARQLRRERDYDGALGVLAAGLDLATDLDRLKLLADMSRVHEAWAEDLDGAGDSEAAERHRHRQVELLREVGSETGFLGDPASLVLAEHRLGLIDTDAALARLWSLLKLSFEGAEDWLTAWMATETAQLYAGAEDYLQGEILARLAETLGAHPERRSLLRDCLLGQAERALREADAERALALLAAPELAEADEEQALRAASLAERARTSR
ncbi:MAG: protein kinase [Planctomycetota bacterium]